MKMLIGAVLLTCVTPAIAGWVGGVSPNHRVSPGRATIDYSADSAKGSATFRDALDDLARRGHVQRLEWVSLQPMLEQRSFQNELRTVLKESAPRELAAALSSAGNMHNPKMIALRRPFAEAVLLTPTVKRISAELARYNLQVAGVSTEKFELWAGEGEKRFMCIVLSLEIVHAAKAGGPVNP